MDDKFLVPPCARNISFYRPPDFIEYIFSSRIQYCDKFHQYNPGTQTDHYIHLYVHTSIWIRIVSKSEIQGMKWQVQAKNFDPKSM